MHCCSPPTRGCSLLCEKLPPTWLLFPAYAGVLLNTAEKERLEGPVPRLRGGAPISHAVCCEGKFCSPPTRGCSSHFSKNFLRGNLFPAYAGVLLCSGDFLRLSSTVPRLRGGAPNLNSIFIFPPICSPPTRGCSPASSVRRKTMELFPAYAGVLPKIQLNEPRAKAVPRLRGGAPELFKLCPLLFCCSPPTRGCS